MTLLKGYFISYKCSMYYLCYINTKAVSKTLIMKYWQIIVNLVFLKCAIAKWVICCQPVARQNLWTMSSLCATEEATVQNFYRHILLNILENTITFKGVFFKDNKKTYYIFNIDSSLAAQIIYYVIRLKHVKVDLTTVYYIWLADIYQTILSSIFDRTPFSISGFVYES